MRNLILLFAITLLFSACAPFKPISNGLVINTVSDHVSDPAEKARNEINLGVGYRWSNKEVGFARNSRVRENYLVYAKKRLILGAHFFADTGAAYYFAGNGYPAVIKPIGSLGYTLSLNDDWQADLSYHAGKLLGGTDVATLQFVYRLGDKK